MKRSSDLSITRFFISVIMTTGGLLMNFHRVREAVETPETGREDHIENCSTSSCDADGGCSK
jgi:hypothetical protein